MKTTLSIILCLLVTDLIAQESEEVNPSITVGAYADAYYAYYSNAYHVAAQQHNSVGAYHNNLGLNTAQLTSAFTSDRLRGVVTLHHGDIAQIAWADQYRPIQEANAGVRLAEGLWLDGGYFKTHVGTESFLPKDNLMSIITLGTFYGPFYQGGFRLSYDVGSTHLEAHVINGYNLHVDNNTEKTVGILASHAFSEQSTLTYSTMYGSEQTGVLDNDNLWYQNIYFNHRGGDLEFQAGLDVAFTTNGGQSLKAGGAPLIASLVTAKLHLSERFSLAGRVEYFGDPSNMNSIAYLPYYDARTDYSTVFVQRTARGRDGLNIVGLTLGVEYSPMEGGFLRLESRYLNNLNGPGGVEVKDERGGFDARQAGFNPHVTERIGILFTAGFYFDKTFNFAR